MKLLAAFMVIFFIGADVKAAFVKDTSFVSYQYFSGLSKKKIEKEFGKDENSRLIIKTHYKQKNKGLGILFGLIPLTAIGTYFAQLAANATNGMGSTVGLILALAFLIPALFVLTIFLKDYVFRKKNSKEDLYEQLKKYYLGDL